MRFAYLLNLPGILVLICCCALGANAQPKVLILGDTESEDEITLALRATGAIVSSLPDYSDWNGVDPSTSDFDVVLLLCGYDYGIGMQGAASQAIASHVAMGGGFVVTEWAAYNVFDGAFPPEVGDLLPVTAPTNQDSSDATWTATDSDHAILTGFPASWYDAAYYSLLELKPGAESIVTGPDSVPLVALSSSSGGPVIHINHALTYSDVQISSYAIQLLVNAVLFAAGSAPEVPSGDVLLLGDGGSEIYVGTALLYAGFDVTFGGFYSYWDGAFPPLENFSTVVFLDGVEFGDSLYAETSTALSNFVSGGGGLVVTEWTSYDVLQNNLDATFASLMPVVQPVSDEKPGGEWTLMEPGHPIASSLPATWSDGSTFSVVEAVEGAQVLATGPNDVPMVTEKSVGTGKVVHVNHSLAYDTTSFNDLGYVTPYALRLIVNAAAYTMGAAPPYPDDSGDVLILGDAFTESETVGLMSDAGFEVSYAGRYDGWDGMFPDPSNYKATLLLDGYYFGYGMEATAEQALADAVAAGGGLVATEWVSYDALQGTLEPAVADLLPVTQPVYAESFGATWTVESASHPVVAGLPAVWRDGEGYSVIEIREGAEALVRSPTGIPLVTYWDSPGGKVIHLNHSMTYWSGGLGPEIRRLIVNSLGFVGDISPSGKTADFNNDGSVDGKDLLFLLSELEKGTNPADLDDSGTVAAPDLYLFSTDWAPGG